MKIFLAVFAGFLAAPALMLATNQSNSFTNSVVGDPCIVPITHTNFSFPKEGGKIVEHRNNLYFIHSYMPGCENTMAGAKVVRQEGAVAGIETPPQNSTPPIIPPCTPYPSQYN